MSVSGVIKNSLRSIEDYGLGQVHHGLKHGHGQYDVHSATKLT